MQEGGFAFANNSFNGNFGLVNVHGIPKPAYRAFQLLHELGDTLLGTDISASSSTEGRNCLMTVGALASKCNSSVLSVLLFSQASLGEHISPKCTTTVTIKAAEFASNGSVIETTIQGSIRRIDENNTAPKQVWLSMGLPQWPTANQISEMFEASIMRKSKFSIQRLSTGDLSFDVDIAANAVVAVQIPLGGDNDVMDAQHRRELHQRLRNAEARVSNAVAEVASLKAQLGLH